MKRSKIHYQRKTISFDIESFDKIVRQIEAPAKSGAEVNQENFYPPVKQHKGKSRDLPMVDHDLRDVLIQYLHLRIDKGEKLKPSSSLFITQKGGPYSPNTLQEHMVLMLRDWAGIEKASSHSGRRTLITHVIHQQKKSVKVAQKIAGHVNLQQLLFMKSLRKKSWKMPSKISVSRFSAKIGNPPFFQKNYQIWTELIHIRTWELKTNHTALPNN